MEKTYVAQRELKVFDGYIQPGELYPPSQVTSSLLSLAWVVPGIGPMPKDRRCHGAFPKGATGARETRVKRNAPKPIEPPQALADVPDLADRAKPPEASAPAKRPARRPATTSTAKAPAKRKPPATK